MANRIPKSNDRATTAKDTNGLSLTALHENAQTRFDGLVDDINERLGKPPTETDNNQRADAFRHAFSAAVVTRDVAATINKVNPLDSEIGQKLSLHAAGSATAALGRGLEGISVLETGEARNNHPDIGMDLHNNERGIAIAKELGINATDKQIAQAVVDDMAKGNLILTNEDRRASEKFDQQYDMSGLQAGRDTAASALQAASDIVESGKQVASGLMERATNAVQVADREDAADTLKEPAQAQAFQLQSTGRSAPESRGEYMSPEAVDKALDEINKTSPFLSDAQSSASLKSSLDAQATEARSSEKAKEANAPDKDMVLGE